MKYLLWRIGIVIWVNSVFLCMKKTATHVDVIVYARQIGLDSWRLQLKIVTLQDFLKVVHLYNSILLKK